MSLKKKVFSGVKWVALANIFQQLLSLISIVIFAKLLSPDDFGLFSILMIFTGFLAIFSDMGTSAALIHVKNPSKELLSSIFYFNLFVGLTLALGLIIFSLPLANYFSHPELQILLQIVSINFIIISFGIVQRTLLQKNIDFKNLSLINSISVLIGLIVGLIAAYFDLGVYSLVIQLMISSLLSTSLIWYYSSWHPLWYFSFSEIKKIWKYTSHLSIFTIINYFSKNADNFLIGKYLSMSTLGVYSIAYRMMLYPLQNISSILMKVLFPAFSQLQDDNEKFKNAYLHVIFYISLVTFPIMTGLIATASVTVDVLFGDKWEGLALILILLAPSGLMRSVFTTVGTIFMAKGSTDIQLKLGTVNAILTVIGFIIGLQWGINGVAFSYLIVNMIMFYPTFKISWGQIELSVKDGLNKLAPVFFISSFMGIAVYLFDFLFFHHIENQLYRLALMVTSGILCYLLMLHIKYGGIKSLLKALKK